MQATMILQVSQLSESFVAYIARKGPFSRMNKLMTLKLGRCRKFLFTVMTFVSITFRIYMLVLLMNELMTLKF